MKQDITSRNSLKQNKKKYNGYITKGLHLEKKTHSSRAMEIVLMPAYDYGKFNEALIVEKCM